MESTKRTFPSEDNVSVVMCANSDRSFSIVPASTADLVTLVSIEHQSFSTPWTRLMFEAELAGNPFSRLFVAKRAESHDSGGDIIGYICYWIVFEELRFLNVAVPPALRGQGIGRQLIEFAIEDGSKHLTKRALLEVRTSNAVARNVYERLGFRYYGIRKSYYANPTEDAILMERTLLDSGPGNTP